MTKLWLLPVLLNGIPFLVALLLTLEKFIKFIAPSFYFPGLQTIAGNAVFTIFFPLLGIFTAVNTYGKTPILYRPLVMRVIKMFLLGWLVFALLYIYTSWYEYVFTMVLAFGYVIVRRRSELLKKNIVKIISWVGIMILVAYSLYVIYLAFRHF